MKINTITEQQKARFGELVEKWTAIGLSTEPADFDAATAAALKAYKLCGLPPPKVILRMGSPYAATLGGAMAWGLLKEFGEVESQVGSEVWSQVWSQVESQVGSQVESQVGSQVRSQVWSQVESQVRSQVRSQVGSQVESQVRSQVRSQVWSQVGSQVESQVESQLKNSIYNDRGGQFWSGWCAYISFLRDALGWDDPVLDRFRIDETLTKSCGWVWWHEDVLVMSDRPEAIKRDDAGRLHCETGPSISYRDGWALHHWHGTAVPAEWVTGKKPSAKDALHWPNIEQRRAACEIVGWANVLRELKAKTINADPDPEIGTLLEVVLPESGKERFLQVLCGTGRTFALPVPKEIKTAMQAQSWTWGLDEKSFQRPEIRT